MGDSQQWCGKPRESFPRWAILMLRFDSKHHSPSIKCSRKEKEQGSIVPSIRKPNNVAV